MAMAFLIPYLFCVKISNEVDIEVQAQGIFGK